MLNKIMTGIIGLLFATNASAVLLSGTGDAENESAVSGGAFVDFENIALGSYSSITVGDFSITGVDANLSVSNQYAGQYNGRGTRYVDNGSDFVPNTFRFDFANGTDAFAFNWGAADYNWTLSAFASDNSLIESFVIAGSRSSNAGDYYGIAASGISYATLTGSNGDWVFIDNVTYINAEQVPVPAPLTLLGLGLVAIGYTRKRTASK